MIVISRALTLGPSSTYNPTLPVIGWHNRVTLAGIAADGENPAFPASNLANPSTASRWQGEDTATQYLTFTIHGNEPVDYVGIARHNLSAGVVVSIEGEDPEDPNSWSEIIEEFIPASDGPILCRFPAAVYSRIRIKLQPDANIPRIAIVYIGKLLVMSMGQSSGMTPIHLGASDEVFRGQSQSGDYLGSIVLRRGLSTSISFQWLDYDWYLENMAPFVEATLTRPFFYAWAPDTYPDQVGFAWSNADVRPTLNAPLFVDVTLSVNAVYL